MMTSFLVPLTDKSKRTNIGHIAVPIQRFAAAGKEEGWYEVRRQDGQVVVGDAGKTAVLVSLTVS